MEIPVGEGDDAALYAGARDLSAAIRHHRSTAGFGFNTRVRVEGLILPSGSWEKRWPLIARDILDGHNVEEAAVSFAANGGLTMTLVPMASDA